MNNTTSHGSDRQESLLPPRSTSLARAGAAHQLAAEYEVLARTRLSDNFILRDFLFSTESASRGLSNFPERPDLVVAAGRGLCAKVLEPVLEHFGRFAVTFGHQCHEAIEAGKMRSAQGNPRSSNPHQWDRQTFGNQVYARVDILPFCVEDGNVTKYEFGHWLMHHLDIDLLMQWRRSNVCCISISPKPRRVWLEWGSAKFGEPRQTTFMGAEYWQRVYPTQPHAERPKFAPSCTGGSMQWQKARP